MTDDVRIWTRLSRPRMERETVVVRGHDVIAVLEDGHPFMELLRTPRGELQHAVRTQAAALTRYLAVHPDERGALAALLQYKRTAEIDRKRRSTT